MPQPRETADLARRDLLRFGLMGASMLALGTGGSIFAGDEGIERKVLKEVDSNIPGFPKLRIRDTIFQPGAVLSERKMANPMICEVTQGTLARLCTILDSERDTASPRCKMEVAKRLSSNEVTDYVPLKTHNHCVS